MLTPRAPARAGVPGAAARARARLLPGRRVRRARARAGAGRPAAGWVNLHFSLLPAWRGAAPVQHALLAGDEVTGATTFLLEEGLDTGPVLGVLTEQVRPTDTAGDLLGRLADAGAGLLVATLDGLEAGDLAPVPQPGRRRLAWPRRSRVEDARVDWTAPGAAGRPAGPRLHAGARRLDDASAEAGQARPGAPTESGCRPASSRGDLVGTATTAVRLARVRPEGKGEMPAADWLRGLRPEPGERLGVTGQHRPRRPRGGPTGRRPPRGQGAAAARPGVRPGPADRVRRARGRPRARRVRQPRAARPAARAPADRRDAGARHRAGVRHAARAGPARRGAAACVDRPLDQVDPPVLDVLRLGAYQLLRTRVPPHAAVSATVDLARRVTTAGPAGFVNAVLRKVAAQRPRRLARRAARPPTRSTPWRCATQPPALGRGGVPRRARRRPRRDPRGAARRRRPARGAPGRPPDAAATSWSRSPAAPPGPWSARAVRLAEGVPGDLAPVRDGRAGVQDEGSQLVALALAAAPLEGPDRRWLDLCAGPGGKAALLDGARRRPRRPPARAGGAAAPGPARPRAPGSRDGGHGRRPHPAVRRRHAPTGCCSTRRARGLGALRRRPEARWRRQPADLPALTRLQGALLDAGRRGAAPRRRARLRHLLAAPGRDRRAGRRRAAPAPRPGAARRPAAAARRARPRRRPGRAAVAAPARHRRDVPRPAAPGADRRRSLPACPVR